MPEIAETALANSQQEIMVGIGGCLTVALSCDDVEAPTIEADNRLGYVGDEIP